MIVQCCACDRVREGNTWVAPTAPFEKGAEISHGYCPVCAAQAFAEIRRHRAEAAGGGAKSIHAA